MRPKYYPEWKGYTGWRIQTDPDEYTQDLSEEIPLAELVESDFSHLERDETPTIDPNGIDGEPVITYHLHSVDELQFIANGKDLIEVAYYSICAEHYRITRDAPRTARFGAILAQASGLVELDNN